MYLSLIGDLQHLREDLNYFLKVFVNHPTGCATNSGSTYKKCNCGIEREQFAMIALLDDIIEHTKDMPLFPSFDTKGNSIC
jgi:hypothetical protein